ncbi:hypothetical protein IVB47_31520, partial [Bradyrhizobium sp. 62]|nr:hypothetical protein [Bradyrhizobium sp. 62]
RLDLFLAARPPLGITIALAIGAATTEGRTFLEDPALILVFTAWTIAGRRFAAGMLVPVGTALGTLARTIEFRAIAAAIEPRTIIARTIELGTIEFGPLAERTITRWTIVARTRKARTVVAAALPIIALLPGLVLTAVAAAEILARTLAEVLARRPVAARGRIALLPRFRIAALAAIAVRCAARKLPLAVELAFRTVATRRVGSLVAKLRVTGSAGRTGIVAIPARRTVITPIGRAITARLERPLVAIARGAIRKWAVATRLERALLAVARRTIGKRTVFTRLEGTIATRLEAALATILAARPVFTRPVLARPVFAIELRAVAEVAARGIALLAAAEGTAVAVAAGRAGVAFVPGRAALGELLVGSAWLAGAALGGAALGRAAITPAAGIVVFVAVARHE